MIEEHEEQLVEAFRSFTRLERILRRTIGEALCARFGTQWTRQIPRSISERIEQRMHNVSESNLGPERESDLLASADFSELVSLVEYYWDEVFHSRFQEKQITFGLLEEVRNYRNALMHSALLAKQCPTFVGLCEAFIKQLENAPRDAVPRLLDEFVLESPQTPEERIPTTKNQIAFHQLISSTLNRMTGLFEGERDALTGYVERNLGLCTPVVLEMIRHKFSGLPKTDVRIDALASRLPPERPKPPQPKWGLDAGKWLKWAANSYLPYRYWMIMNNQVDSEIEAMGDAYETWLYSSYVKLLRKAPQRFVYSSYTRIIKLLEQDKVVLWILIDNLPLFSQSVLMRYLSEHGFRVLEMIRQISMLPSDSAASRRSALTGRLPSQIPEDKSEMQAFGEAWQSRTDKRIAVLKDLRDLENLDQYQADLFVYVYSRLDSLWHTPSSKDFEHEEEIEMALARLVAKLCAAMTQLTQRDPALLVISTDHGSIYLHEQSRKLPIPLSAVKDVSYEKHRRFIRTSRQDALNSVDWFYLDKDEFHLHHSYAIARGWRYIETRPRGFTHGGLSPEETIIPLLVCELGESEFERIRPILL
jgi:hypothetical protein